MDRVIDLDTAAALLEVRASTWRGDGFQCGPITWRDAAAAWDAPFQTERARVQDPDSIGIRLHRGESEEVDVVLFRGGWADVNLFNATAEAIVVENPQITTLGAFENLLDELPARLASLRSA